MRIDRYFKPTATLIVGMASLAIVEMVFPKVASAIVTTGSKVKKALGGK